MHRPSPACRAPDPRRGAAGAAFSDADGRYRWLAAEARRARPLRRLVTGFTLHYRGAMPMPASSSRRRGGHAAPPGPSLAAARHARRRRAVAPARPAAAARARPGDCRVRGARRHRHLRHGAARLPPGRRADRPLPRRPLMFRHGPARGPGRGGLVATASAARSATSRDAPTRACCHAERCGLGRPALRPRPGDDRSSPPPDPVGGLPAAARRRLPAHRARRAVARRLAVAHGGAERPELVSCRARLRPRGAWRGPAMAQQPRRGDRRFPPPASGLRPAAPRLVVAVFDGDPFDPDPGGRAAMVAQAATAAARHPGAAPEPAAARPCGAIDWRFTRVPRRPAR